MRYTILGFRQSEIVKRKVSAREVVFLRWFIDFMTTLRMKWIIVSDKTYFWVDNNTVMEELPILGIKHATNLRRFLKGMVNKGILNYHLNHGNRPFYMVNHKTISDLLSYVPKAKNRRR